MSGVRRFGPAAGGDFRWDGVELLRYKQDGSAPFKDITRQVLFAQPDQACELRYFEVAPGGYSTLERHQHPHAVVILRGRGTVILGDRVHAVEAGDCVYVAPQCFHQFHANAGEALGFLCVVSRERDRPVLPSAEELARLREVPEVARLLRV